MERKYLCLRMMHIRYNIIGLITAICVTCILGCVNEGDSRYKVPQYDTIITNQGDTITVSSVPDSLIIYRETISKENCFVIISKKYLQLKIYEAVDKDTFIVASIPVCLSRNKGNKSDSGDMRTPESSMEDPFVVEGIQDASCWTHDFGDGRGEILAYGKWFVRLKTPGFHGIGIHGSTNNEKTVPGRASEGCIRLRDSDIVIFKEKYAFEGMRVVIQHEDEDLFPFETNETKQVKTNKK